MKHSGALQKIPSVLTGVSLLFLAYLLSMVYVIVSFFFNCLVVISCLTLRCVKGANALLKTIAGGILRLQIAGKATLQRRHSQKKVATTFGT
jgi:hypothetical protein